jgi:hypothetical protein
MSRAREDCKRGGSRTLAKLLGVLLLGSSDLFVIQLLLLVIRSITCNSTQCNKPDSLCE